MAYAIRVIGIGDDLYEIKREIENRLALSRFKIERIEIHHASKRARKYKGGAVSIHGIRLRELKPYCGNHPGPCPIGGKDKRYRYLEGLDWVEFNDTINDVLDELNIEAHVSSSECETRVGLKRRVHYRMERFVFNKVNESYGWAKKGYEIDYEDWCGKKAPRSRYPKGTPGLLTELKEQPTT